MRVARTSLTVIAVLGVGVALASPARAATTTHTVRVGTTPTARASVSVPGKKKAITTGGAGYLSKPGAAFDARTYLTVPTVTCTADDAEASQGVFLFQPDGKPAYFVGADELCSRGGAPDYVIELIDYVTSGEVTFVPTSPGDQVETDIEENSTETYLFAEDTTIGTSGDQDDPAYPTANVQMLDGEVNPTAVTGIGLADFGTATFSYPTFNYKAPPKAHASLVSEETKGVVQATASKYDAKTATFSVTWKHI